MGIFQAIVDFPCADGSPPGCRQERPILPFVLAAVDALDRVEGNLFQGNGGPTGSGYTSDLVIRFPRGTTLSGVPVPEELHSGLDIEAGEVLPIGIDLVQVSKEEGLQKPYLPELTGWGYEGAPEGKVRFRLACAVCHSSLDVDADGRADMPSTKLDNPMPDSPYQPQHGWGVGNQDIAFGWLFSMSANPLPGSLVLAGALGQPGSEPSIAYLNWLMATYKSNPKLATQEVIAGMLAQPRGYADVTTDGIYNPTQLPTLYTRYAWPSNSEDGQSNGRDRHNAVWTGTLDFTGLIDLCSDRSGANKLPWEPRSVFNRLSCADFADLMTRYSPAVIHDPSRKQALVDDILGISDGLSGMATLDLRIAIEPKEREKLKVYADRYGLTLEDLQNEAVSLALDGFEPPPNNTPLLTANVDRVPKGYEVFQEEGCVSCHRGPFGTDNIIYPLSADPRVEFGGPRAPSTAGWRTLGRGDGPAINTEPQRAINGRPLHRLVSPPYDPATGAATRQGGVLQGLLSVQRVGYKTTALRYLWGSAPYLHDGGVGVALRPGTEEGTDLRALLRRAGSEQVIYGMGEILSLGERSPTLSPKTNAALSLQALVLRTERERVIAANELENYEVPAGSTMDVVRGGPPIERVSMRSIGIAGYGHDFYISDVPGGERVTSLVAYLLSLDDCPRRLPGYGEPCTNSYLGGR